MSKQRLASALVFVAGGLFAAGLAISGMTQPSKVIGFLDFFGAWDPSLAFVMGGALAVFVLGSRLVARGGSSLAGTKVEAPAEGRVDAPLLLGAAIFGVGWGLSGFCPGPGIVSLGSASSSALIFVGGMAAGQLVFERTRRRERVAQAAEAAEVDPVGECG